MSDRTELLAALPVPVRELIASTGNPDWPPQNFLELLAAEFRNQITVLDSVSTTVPHAIIQPPELVERYRVVPHDSGSPQAEWDAAAGIRLARQAHTASSVGGRHLVSESVVGLLPADLRRQTLRWWHAWNAGPNPSSIHLVPKEYINGMPELAGRTTRIAHHRELGVLVSQATIEMRNDGVALGRPEIETIRAWPYNDPEALRINDMFEGLAHNAWSLLDTQTYLAFTAGDVRYRP